jgi:orotidine-5'-phosphate decarboxylase
MMAHFKHTRERVIVALDTTNAEEINDIVGDLTGRVWGFKIGLEAMNKFGAPQAVKMVRRISPLGKIFFDGKFHDIPNTIAGTTKAILPLGVELFNIHASAGQEGIRAALAISNGSPMMLLGVTVLTSHSEDACNDIFGAAVDVTVMKFARLLARNGADGLVCSAHEAAAIKADPVTAELLTVVPGIRLPGDTAGDQSRIMTPGCALSQGADLLVMGRSLTNPTTGSRLEALARTEANIDETLANIG